MEFKELKQVVKFVSYNGEWKKEKPKFLRSPINDDEITRLILPRDFNGNVYELQIFNGWDKWDIILIKNNVMYKHIQFKEWEKAYYIYSLMIKIIISNYWYDTPRKDIRRLRKLM